MSVRERKVYGDMKQRSTGPSKATQYRGNGKVSYQTGGMMIPRPLTDEEKHVEAYIREKYKDYIADFMMLAGTNMQKPIWMLRFENGVEAESYQGPHELEHEVMEMIKRAGHELNGEE